MNTPALLLLACSLVPCAIGETEAEKKALQEAKAEVAAENANKPTLLVTAEQAVIKANATAKARGTDLSFVKLPQKPSGPQYSIGKPEFGVLSFIQTDGKKPNSALFLAKLEGGDALNIMAAMILVFRGVDPELSHEKATEISLLFADKIKEGVPLEAEGVACKFSAHISTEVGFLVSVEPLRKKAP